MNKIILAAVFLTSCLLSSLSPANAGSVTGNLSPGTVISTHPGATTESTSLAARLSHTINVADDISPPVVCDGKTDNAKAFAALYAAEEPGDVLYFPPSFSVNGVLPCLSSTALQGKPNVTFWAYPGTVIIEPTVGSTANPLVFSGASGETLYGLTIDGGGQNFSSANNVMVFYQTQGVTLDHNTIQNTRGIGVIFSGATNETIENNWFVDVGGPSGITNNAQALSLCCGTEANNTGNDIYHNTFIKSGLDSISVSNVNGLTVQDNYCNGNQDQVGQPADPACIYVEQSIGVIQITGNTAMNEAGNGFDLSYLSDVVLNDNIAEFNGSNGFTDYSNPNWSATGNVAIDNCQFGTRFGACAGFTFAAGSSGATNGSMTMSGNEAYDDQSKPTQQYGVYSNSATTFSQPFSVNHSNIIYNNSVANIGGGGPIKTYTP